MRSEGHAVESICRVLREQGCQIAARTYRDWVRTNRAVASRTISDAIVTNQVRDLAWKVDHEGVRRMTPEALYGRRKMTALVRRTTPGTSPGSVDRAMTCLGLDHFRTVCRAMFRRDGGGPRRHSGDELKRTLLSVDSRAPATAARSAPITMCGIGDSGSRLHPVAAAQAVRRLPL